jgi:hypothetical protein
VKRKMRKNLIPKLTAIAAVFGGLIYFSYGIKTSESMPSYAVVFVDDISKTYLAPQCVEEWQTKPTKTVDLLRRTTAGEAYRRQYIPDSDCRETGAFSEDGYPLPLLLLVKTGVLPPKKHWWDMPYRTENGVVYPHP